MQLKLGFGKIVLLDVNENPILIENLYEFNEIAKEIYSGGINGYYQEFEELRKARSVEKIVSNKGKKE